MGIVLGRLGKGWSLLVKTVPILVVRLGMYFAFTAGMVIYLLFFAGLAYLMQPIWWIIMLVALAGLGGIWYWVRRYLLYMVRAAHVAVMTEIIVKEKLPAGVSQYAYGKEVITTSFKDISILFAVDALVEGILKAFTRTVANIVDILPLPGIEKGAKAVMRIIERSLTYIDEAIFSYGLTKRDEQTLWASAKEGVLLYAQSWQELLKVAVGIWLIGAVSFFVLLALFLIPGLAIGFFLPSSGKLVIGIMVLAAAYIINLALYEPLGLAAMIVTFHEEIKDKQPDPAWEERLESISSKFGELKNQAEQSMKTWGKSETPEASSTAAGS
jgi:hypothetical protein